MKIKIKYFSEEIEKLKFIDGKSDWIDLRAAERVEMKSGDYRPIQWELSMSHIAVTMMNGDFRHWQ